MFGLLPRTLSPGLVTPPVEESVLTQRQGWGQGTPLSRCLSEPSGRSGFQAHLLRGIHLRPPSPP